MMMRSYVFLFVLVVLPLDVSSSQTHLVQTLCTVSAGLPNLPEFSAVVLVDDVQVVHYDSDSRTVVPKQDWVKETAEKNSSHWEEQTKIIINSQQILKNIISNRTGDVVQEMVGCEWDPETGTVTGFLQYGVNGEDFLIFNQYTLRWIAAKQEAVVAKGIFDKQTELNAAWKKYLTRVCPEWLKILVAEGKSFLMRKELPTINFLQKSPSSSVTCHATGFYPDRAALFWVKDRKELSEDVELGEILPNHDGTFQMSVNLDLSSVKHEDWERYECVFQLWGVSDDIFMRLDRDRILSNVKSNVTIIIFTAAVVVVYAVAVAFAGFVVYKRKQGKRPSPPPSDTDVIVKLNPPI